MLVRVYSSQKIKQLKKSKECKRCNVSATEPILDHACLPHSGVLRTQKLKSHQVRTQSLNVLPLNPGVGQYIAMHATLTARDFCLAYFYPSGPFTWIFSKTSPDFFPVLAVANTGSCIGLQNTIGHPAGCRFLCTPSHFNAQSVLFSCSLPMPDLT